MDELNNLKNIWDSFSDTSMSSKYTIDELKKIAGRKSKSEILKIKRKFVFEWILSMILSVLLVGFVHMQNSSMTVYAGGLVLILFAISVIPFVKLARRKAIPQSNMKQYLKVYLERYEELKEHIVKLHTYLIPLGIIGGYVLGYVTVVSKIVSYELTIDEVFICIAVIVPVTIVAYFFSKRFANWVYGKNIKRLKDCLAELENEETD